MRHSNRWMVVMLIMIIAVLQLSAWSGETAPEATVGSQASEEEFEDFDPNNFDHPTTIDNQWFPLKPGTQFVYEGFTVEDEEEIPHRIVFTVTDLTKVINGVSAVVIFDRDFSDGELQEAELTFFAQDNDGNVWHLGQYSETYDAEELVGGQAFLVGHLEGVRAGIMMLAEPKLGTPSYSQGFAPPPFNFTDRGRVFQTGQQTNVPFGDFEDVLVIEEFNQEEPNAFQLKYYAPSVGNVRVGWRGADAQQETLELIDVAQLSGDALEEVRAEALELETRASMYGSAPPAEHK